MRVVVLVLAVCTAACLEPDLVDCSDGRSCPGGTVCDVEHTTCIDPRGVSLPAGAIDFASVGCGATAEIIVPMRNFGLAPVEFEARSTVAGVTVTPATGSIASGASLDLHVMADPGAQSIPGVTVEGTLVISTSFELLERPVRMTTVGALATTMMQTVDFGENPLAATVVQPLTVLNEGNAGMDVSVAIPSLGPGAPVFTVPAGSAHVDPGRTRTFDLQFKSDVIDTFAAQAALTFTGDLCQPPPASVALSAVTTGAALLVDHTVVDFGTSACDAPEKTSSVVLTSKIPGAQILTAVVSGLDAGDFALGVLPGLPAGPSMATVDVTRLVIPTLTKVGGHMATLTITASPSGLMKTVGLIAKINAPVLTIDTDVMDFGTVPTSSATAQTLRVLNTGTAVANVTVDPPTLAGPGGLRITVQPSAFQVPVGGAVTLTVTFIAGTTKIGIADALFTFSSPGQCSTPPVLDVTGLVH